MTDRPDEQVCCDPYCLGEERYPGELWDTEDKLEKAEAETNRLRKVLQQIATAEDMTAAALQDWAQDALRSDA